MSELRIAGYEYSQWVGSGLTGEVFRAQRADGSLVAVKKLNALAIDRDRLRGNWRRLWRAPKHPGAVSMLDFQVDASPYFVAMDWIESGRTLAESELPSDDNDNSWAWSRLMGLAQTLADFQKYGVHHANLHPGNVFLVPGDDGDGQLLISDFGPGLAGAVHHIEIGESAWFAPPEQLDAFVAWQDGAVEKWDVYRFGALAFWMLTGEVPRGLGYRAAREMAIAESGGRPVAVEALALAEDFRSQPEVRWPEDSGGSLSRENRYRRELITRCLAIDPEERPADMREVATAFDFLERQFEIERAEAELKATKEEAEARVMEEQERQARKVLNGRLMAACLAGALLISAMFLVQHWQRAVGFETRASDLGQVVSQQKSMIEEYDRRWSQTVHELRSTREAADSVFSQINQSERGSAAPPAEGSIEHENLEKSRAFFVKAIEEAAADPNQKLEHARSLHNLAHVETRLGKKEEALAHLRETVTRYEEILAERSGEVTVVHDTQSRLADCHEALVGLLDSRSSDEMLQSLREASRYLTMLAARRSDDPHLPQRRLAIDFRLARQWHEQRHFAEALAGYSSLGERLQDPMPREPENRQRLEILGEVQYHTALTLREMGREREAGSAFVAAMETLSQLVGTRPYSAEQSLRLGSIYASLGEMMLGRASNGEAKELFNEAYRLLLPISEARPEHLETAVLLARSMSRLGGIERASGRWTDGYRLSLRAIENLEQAIKGQPGDLDARLLLVELRAEHTETLKHQDTAARSCLGKGFGLAEVILTEINDSAELPDGLRQSFRLRLAKLYETYGELCKKLGDSEKAELCFDRAHRARELLVQREPVSGAAESSETKSL